MVRHLGRRALRVLRRDGPSAFVRKAVAFGKKRAVGGYFGPRATYVRAARAVLGPRTADDCGAVPVDPSTERFELAHPGRVPNSAWTCWTDERGVIDWTSQATRLLVGSVSAGGEHGGDINLLWCDLDGDRAGFFQLHDGLDQDDHNNPAVLVRPDGRYLAVYSEHNSPFTRWRISTDPHDPTDWGPEQLFDHGSQTTYANVYRLPDDDGGRGRTYCFTRGKNWDPTCLLSSDAGTSWRSGGTLLTHGSDTTRPYLRFAADEAAIHFITTEGHPREEKNSIYHGVVRDGVVYDSAGNVAGESLLDGGGAVPAPADLTTVFESGSILDGVPLVRAWVVDIAVADGRPTVLFQVRADDEWRDHRLCYGTCDGGGWTVEQVAKTGPGLYGAERDYTGWATLDPADPGRLVVSMPTDPRTGESLAHHQLFAGRLEHVGGGWTWSALTPEATADNLRPYIPAGADDRLPLLWMRGDYESYTDWSTVAVVDRHPFREADSPNQASRS